MALLAASKTWFRTTGSSDVESLIDGVEQLFDELFGGTTAAEIAAAVVVLIATWPAAVLIGWLVQKAVLALPRTKVGVAVFAKRCTHLLVALTGIAWALAILDVGPGFVLVVVIGVTAIVIMLAQPLVATVAASMAVPYWVGDQIETHDTNGTVREVTLRATIIETLDRRRVHIPNRDVLTNPIVIYSASEQRRSSVDVGIAYGTDVDEVSDLIVRAVTEIEGVHGEPPPHVKLIGFEDGMYRLAIRWWHDPDLKLADRTTGAVLAEVKRTLDGAGVPIPPPSSVFLSELPSAGRWQ